MLPFFPLNHPCQNIHLKPKQRIIHRDLSGDGITEQLREMERARIEGGGEGGGGAGKRNCNIRKYLFQEKRRYVA